MDMKKMFKCAGNEGEAIPKEILEDLNLTDDEANKSTDNMVKVSKAIKEYNGSVYNTVPFCHTVEAEAFGSTIILDGVVGNRVGEYAIKDIDSIFKISKMDLDKGRIKQVLKSISELKKQGEKVRLDITGPISIATSIMDTQLFYKAVRKDREKIDELLKLIEDSLVEYMKEGLKQGVDIISFADPTGTIDIVGPKLYKDISGQSTYNILKRMEDELGQSIIHLCGKTSTSLEAIGLLETERIQMSGLNYEDIIEKISKERKDIKFIGHWCLKLKKYNKEIVHCKIK